MAVTEFIKGVFYASQEDPPKILLCTDVEDGFVYLRFKNSSAVWEGPTSEAIYRFNETNKTWNDEEKN